MRGMSYHEAMRFPTQSTVVIGSGEQSPLVLQTIAAQRQQHLVICADGGANYAMECGLVPDYLVGDFDSISKDALSWLQSTAAQIIEYPADKDASDVELAIDLACTLEYRRVVLTSILGLRFDHSFSNLLFLTSKKYRSIDLSICEETVSVSPLREEPTQFSGERGDTFSIIPLSSVITGLTITGSEWDLLEATIPMGSTWSISNKFKGSTVTAKIREGSALFFHLCR